MKPKLLLKKAKLFQALFLLLLFGQTIAQTLPSNTVSTISWAFNTGLAGQTATYTDASFYKPDNVTVGANYVYKGTIKGTNPTTTYTALRNNTAANTPVGVNSGNLIGFEFSPLTGLNFKPTTISFDCQKFGTGSGIIDVYWLSSDGTSTVIKEGIVPAREANAISEGADTNTFTMDVFGLSIPNLGGKSVLAIYIHSLGSAKDVGLANISISGNLNGTVANVNQYTVTTSVLPALAGVITSNNPATVDEGTVVNLTAKPNFGYSFLNWTDELGNIVSTTNPYSSTVTANTTLKANFNMLNTFALNLDVNGGGKDYMLTISPIGTMVAGQRMYEEGTNVLLTANSNAILNFSNWGTGETTATLNVIMDANKSVSAEFNTLDYILGWDFYKTGNNGRIADFSSNVVNDAASLVLRNATGTQIGWLDKSVISGGYEGRGAAVNWQSLTNNYYYQIKFNAADYTDISVKAAMMYNYNAYSKQLCEYSLDGITFTGVGVFDLVNAKQYYENTLVLPVDANNKSEVYIRWIPDYTSPVIGASGNDGTVISGIYVFGSKSILNDGTAPVLTSSVPANTTSGASASGKVVLNFDERVQITTGATATLNGKSILPVVVGKSISFNYSGLEYNTTYTFDLAGNVVSDLGNNTLTTAISISFTTLNKPTVTKKAYDFIVGVDGDFKAALVAADAAKSSGNRFYIFFPNGEYDLGATTGDTTQQTIISLPNISFIGQSTTGVTLFNSPTQLQEGIDKTPTINFTTTANNVYMQDLTLLNKMDYRLGIAEKRAVALRHQGDKNIFKNVRLLSNQDTYFTGAGRTYWENGEIHGTVDYIFGDGDIFFNQCLLYMEKRVSGGGIATAAATSSNFGYVFNNCTIDGDAQQKGIFGLGRPWNAAPKVYYINTTMNILPTASAWGDPMNVVPYRFAEYNSLTSAGVEIDLSNRRTLFTLGTTSITNNPILSKAEADQYTIENILGGTDLWQPKLATEQAKTPVLSNTGTTLNWDADNYVLGWAIFKDDVFVKFTTINSYTTIGSTGKYTVRAANAMGGLSAKSNELDVATLGLGENTLNVNEVVVSPNPTHSIANIQIGRNAENTTLALYNLLGQKLWSAKVTEANNESTPVDLSSFNSGVYLLKIDNGVSTKTIKIIKK